LQLSTKAAGGAAFVLRMATVPQSERVLSFEQARKIVEDAASNLLHGPTFPNETVDLLASAGRVLAERVVSDRDLPPFHRATRDGFALRANDVARASEAAPALLRVIGEVKAGSPEHEAKLQAGEALEIMTGAPAPPGEEHAVVMLEHTSRDGNKILVKRSARPGENIVPAGSEAQKGTTLLEPGHRMDYAAIALAASVGKTELRVYRRPRVAIVSTGDEVVEINAKPRPHQIRNSNSYSLAAQIQAAGGEPVQLPIAPDDLCRLRELVGEGLTSDLLLLSGGVSMGKYDLVEQVLAEFGAEFLFTGALIQPGRPVVFGFTARADGAPKFFFGLPGNPVSTMVTFELFAKPMIDALSGTVPQPLTLLRARLKAEIKTKTGLTRFLPALLMGSEVELVPWQGSGDIVATAEANCYVVVPPDRAVIPAWEMVQVLIRR
jgi:molybdopterin molybdotransferase